MEYVYMYMHPNEGYVYIGRTNNLKSRIMCHNKSQNDNIPREYENLLNESTIYYIELPNKALSISAESFLINKHKPLLNKALKYEDNNICCCYNITVPKWKLFSDYVEKERLNKLSSDIDSVNEEIKIKNKELKKYQSILLECKEAISKSQMAITYYTEIEEDDKIYNNIGFKYKDIVKLYQVIDISNVVFYGKTYNIVGDEVLNANIHLEENNIVFEYKVKDDNSTKKIIIGKTNDKKYGMDLMESVFVDNLCNAIYEFFPDRNICKDLIVLLSVEKDLIIEKNKGKDFFDIVDKNKTCQCLESLDRENGIIKIRLENGVIQEYNGIDYCSNPDDVNMERISKEISSKLFIDIDNYDKSLEDFIVCILNKLI